MIYLGLMILGAILLVAFAIRRLPLSRAHRVPMDYPTPTPYVRTPTSAMTDVKQKVQSLGTNLFAKRPPPAKPVESTVSPLLKQPYNEFNQPSTMPSGPQFVTTTSALPGKSAVAGEEAAEAPPMGTEQFWQEATAMPDPLELPTKGLISRRGESQRVAHDLITRADEAFKNKDYKTAETYYLQAAVQDPDNAKIYNRLGVIYLQAKNYKDAIEAFRGALKYDDRVASRHYNIALAYLGKRDYRSAVKGLEEAIRLDPTNDKYRKTLQAIQKQPA